MEKKTWETCEDPFFNHLSSADLLAEDKSAKRKRNAEFIDSFGHLTVDSLLQREPVTETIYSEVISNARRYIHENFSRKISIDEIARHCCMSQYHFSRIFKEFTDLPPHRYLQDLRLKHAETLLKAGQLPVAEVGLRSGFNSLAYFSTAFSKKYKVPPTKFKEQYQ